MTADWDHDTTETDGYTPDAFYTQSSDKKGHNVSANLPRTFRVPPQLAHQIELLISDPRNPYDGKAAFVRDAIVHRLAYLNAAGDLVQDFTGANNFVVLMDKLHREEELERHIDQSIAEIERRAKEYIRTNQPDKLADLFGIARMTQVEPLHRRRWLKLLDDLEEAMGLGGVEDE